MNTDNIQTRNYRYPWKVFFSHSITAMITGLFTFNLHAQYSNIDTTLVDPGSIVYRNTATGEFTPGKRFQLVKSEYGSLNLSIYGMARWVSQMPGEDAWNDHRDSLRVFEGRNDIYWHRAMIWFTGSLETPKLTYMATVWTVATTQ